MKTANDFLPLLTDNTERNEQGSVIEIEGNDDADDKQEGENK